MSEIEGATWDHIVVGAGSAGCALAARLGEAGRRVLVLEAGSSDRGNLWLKVPIGIGRVIQNNDLMWKYFTEPQAQTGNRRLYWPRGKVAGGSSSVNGMIWVLGDPARYDQWEAAGCPGWGWDAMAPLFSKIEAIAFPGAATRGRNGPVAVEEFAAHDGVTESFLNACEAEGIARTVDYNSFPFEGAGRLQMSTQRGVRRSASVAYLWPAVARGNVHVKTNALVESIIFDGASAVGVRYKIGGMTFEAHANADVIVSAGTINSPNLLERSGIGAPDRLAELGVSVKSPLVGVGENLSDHYHVRTTWRSRNVTTFNDLMRQPWRHGPPALVEYLLNGSGFFGSISATAHALARTAPDSRRPDMKIQLHKMSTADRTSYSKGSGLDAFSGLSIGFFQLYPTSRGSVHIVSTDPAVLPQIIANYLETEEDREAVIRGLRLTRRIAGQPQMSTYFKEETRPGADRISDDELLEYARMSGQTSYHPVGTCSMGCGPYAVVDNECRVLGVTGLRVIDASIMPFIVASNTNAASIAVGERGAQLMTRSNF